MSETQFEVVKHVKQLENQNNKLRRLLITALEVADKDAESFTRLKQESEALEEEVGELENEKQHLEEVLASIKSEDSENIGQTIYNLEREHVELRSQLEQVLGEIRRGNLEIDQLKSEDAQLKSTILRLENEKRSLLDKLKIVELKESELSQLSYLLKEKVSQIEEKQALIIVSSTKIIENEECSKCEPKFINTTGRPTTIVDIIKDRLYDELQETIARSTEDVENLKSKLSDPEIMELINDIEVQKKVLLNNLKLLKVNERKEFNLNEINSSLTEASETETRTVEFGPGVSHLETENSESRTSESPLEEKNILSNESEQQSEPSTSSDQATLDELVSRLEQERAALLRRLHSISETSAQQFEERILQTQSELHSTFMREVSSEELVESIGKKYDDATNQLYADEESRLEQRIRELEAENDRIKRELEVLIAQLNGDAIISPERMITVQLKEKIAEMEKQEFAKKA